MLGLRFCARAFSSCGKRGPLFITVRGPLTIAASPVAEHRLQTRRLSNCGSRAQPLRGMWDLPRPGLEPVSPALAGRLPTTAPPGKPRRNSLLLMIIIALISWVSSVSWEVGPALYIHFPQFHRWDNYSSEKFSHRQSWGWNPVLSSTKAYFPNH